MRSFSDFFEKKLFRFHAGVLADLSDVSQENPNCVLLGDAVTGFHYDALNSAFQVLTEHPKLFSMGAGFVIFSSDSFALHAENIASFFRRYYKHGTKLMLDVGPFLKALEVIINRNVVKIRFHHVV